jgi:Phytanoyl-CoA dioxygenase (PhyH)
MQVIPDSHLRGPAPHVPAEDINLCTIRPDLVRLDECVALPMDPGDVLIFHSLIHHYTAANYSDRRRRALQFHYHQVGTGLDVTGGPSGAVSWRGWSLRGLHRAEGRTVCRSLQLRSQPVAAGRADGIGLSGETLA